MNLRQLYRWVGGVSKDWEGVTQHFRENVGHFSRGVVRSGSSQLRKIAGMVEGKADSQRRRLQRFVQRAQPLEHFFGQWTGSVLGELALVQGQPIVLVVDETKVEDRFGVMVVGVAHERRCLPLAWRVYRANDSAGYPPEGQARMIIRLLKQVRAGIPPGRRVRVVADRGIGTSPLLMRGIAALGWTFLFRVTKQSKIILPDGQDVTFHDQVQQPGQTYAASGLVFKRRGRIPAHVRVVWGQDAEGPWALVTNDPSLSGWEYAQRFWVEPSFRDFKSHGWQLEATTLTDPDRLSRLWVFLVVAYAWMLLLGLALDAAHALSAPKRRPDGFTVRRLSLFREGRQAFLTACCPPG
jgi:Transposase DDE domain